MSNRFVIAFATLMMIGAAGYATTASARDSASKAESETSASEKASEQKTAQADADKKDDDDKIVCKTKTATGSRIKKNKICKTKRQWRQLAESTRRDLDNFTTAASRGGTGQGDN